MRGGRLNLGTLRRSLVLLGPSSGEADEECREVSGSEPQGLGGNLEGALMLALPPAHHVTPHTPFQAPDKSSWVPSFPSSLLLQT